MLIDKNILTFSLLHGSTAAVVIGFDAGMLIKQTIELPPIGSLWINKNI